MSSPYTTEHVCNLLSQKGYSLADPFYIPKQKTNIVCPLGHTFSIHINNFKDGYFCCKDCKDIQFLQSAQKELAPFGYTIVGYLDKGKRKKFETLCNKCNTKSSLNWGNFKNRGIKKCATCNKKPVQSRKSGLTPEEKLDKKKQKLKEHGLELIELNKDSAIIKSIPCGHQFKTYLHNFLRNPKCIDCYPPINVRYALEEVRAIFTKEGYAPQFTQYNKNSEKLHVKTPNGDDYYISLANFLKGKRCAIGTVYEKKDTLDVRAIVEEKGYKLNTKEYKDAKQKLELICKNGHVWPVSLDNFNRGRNCPDCSEHGTSKGEKELMEWVKNLFPSAIKTKKQLNKKDKRFYYGYDIYIPELRLLIEFDGLIWHSEKFSTPKKYRKTWKKMKHAIKLGYRFVCVREDEWRNKRDQVKNHLLSIMGLAQNKVSARDTKCIEITKEMCNQFLIANHIQGGVSGEISFGLYYDNELIGVVLGGKHHRVSDDGVLVLKRMAFKNGTTVVGGASKLLSKLVSYSSSNGYTKIISWSDNRYSEGNVYQKMGFVLAKDESPDYGYVKGTCFYSKQSLKKKNLLKKGATGNTEREMALSLGYYRIWDCGKKRWELLIIVKSENRPSSY
jgi:hypothetical protein